MNRQHELAIKNELKTLFATIHNLEFHSGINLQDQQNNIIARLRAVMNNDPKKQVIPASQAHYQGLWDLLDLVGQYEYDVMQFEDDDEVGRRALEKLFIAKFKERFNQMIAPESINAFTLGSDIVTI